jgi:hypothetical protein
MPRRIAPHDAPNLGAYELRKAIHSRGLRVLARWLGIAEWSLDRYCNGRRPKRQYREQLWLDLHISKIFWEIRLVGNACPPICRDSANGGQNEAHDDESAGTP